MDATNHFDNVTFLLGLLALPNRHRKTTLQLITPELLEQGRKASETIQLPPSLAARASTLLEAGDIVDWALALVIRHLHASNATTTTEQLEKKTSLVRDDELKVQLMCLVSGNACAKQGEAQHRETGREIARCHTYISTPAHDLHTTRTSG